jgi:hypothetical protein
MPTTPRRTKTGVGLRGPYDFKLATSFDTTVSVQGRMLVVVQHLVIYLHVVSALNDASGNIVDKTVTDTFTIGIDSNGRIVLSKPSSATIDKSQSPGVNGFLDFWAPVNEIAGEIKQWSLGPAKSLTDIKLSDLQDFILPGSDSLTSLDAAFSENQDLVSHFKYAIPS